MRDKLPPRVRRALRLRRDLDDQVEGEVDAEIRFHLEQRIDDLVAEGCSREEARGQAVEEFGDVEAATRALRSRAIRNERSARRTEWWGDVGRDLRYAWRKLAGEPVFAVVAVLTLALGIGANTAIFSVVHAVLLRPLPYPDADRLVAVWETSPTGESRNVVSRGNFMDWRDQAGSFEVLGAYGGWFGVTYLPDRGEPSRVQVARATPGLFRALGVEALQGRTFAAEEGVPGSGSVVVLSYGFWRRHLGGEGGPGDGPGPEVVGRQINLDGDRYTVVGVMPPTFDFPDPEVDVWVPWTLDEEDRQNRRSHNMLVVGRLEPDVSAGQAEAELDAMAARFAELYPEDMTGWGVNVQGLRADRVASAQSMLLVLLGAVGLVLLLACANLANLLLARALARDREVAVRGVLGASRGRLVRQFLTEAGLLAVVSGALALLTTALGMDVFLALAPTDLPYLDDVRMDGTVLAFTAGATLLATLLFGLLPALEATDRDLSAPLRGASGGRGPAHGRARAGLLVLQVAVTVVLLVGSGLLFRSFVALQSQDYGFDRSHLLTAGLDLPGARYDGTPDHVAFYDGLIERVEAMPGVVSAAGSTDLPAGFTNMTFSFVIEGRVREGPDPREDDEPLRIVTPGYFETLRVPMREGRAFTRADGPDAPDVLVINESLRRKHWPDESPVGTRISFEGHEGPWLEIVGVVGDTRHYGVDVAPGPALFMPLAQKRWDWASWLNLIVRTEADPLTLAPAVRSAVVEMDPQLVPGRMARLEDLYAETNARRRFATALLGGFAGLALLLGCVGVYGILSYTVASRTREFGVRLALGAPRSRVAAGIVARGLGLVTVGVAAGLPAAFVLSRYLESLVYGVSVRDPVTFALVPVVLMGVAVLAAAVPARRVMRVDAVQALRGE